MIGPLQLELKLRSLTPVAAAGRTNIGLLEREYQFWQANRTIDVQKDGRTYRMYRYNVEVGQPRPESYRCVLITRDEIVSLVSFGQG